jgi:hypothetical protein
MMRGRLRADGRTKVHDTFVAAYPVERARPSRCVLAWADAALRSATRKVHQAARRRPGGGR